MKEQLTCCFSVGLNLTSSYGYKYFLAWSLLMIGGNFSAGSFSVDLNPSDSVTGIAFDF